MKQYVIDELRLDDYQKIKAYLDQEIPASGIDEIYWIPIETQHLSQIQASHTDCQPFYFAAHLQESSLACELLVRSQNKIKCDCVAYAGEAQRNWLIRTLDSILEKLEIKV